MEKLNKVFKNCCDICIFHHLEQIKEKVKVKSVSRVRLFVTPWTITYQAPQSMEFSRQEYWSELPFPTPKDLPNPGIELHWETDSLPLVSPGKPKWMSMCCIQIKFYLQKEVVKRIRRQDSDWKKIFEKHTLIKDCYPKYTKNS